ncbi:MAG TPA: VCBS repeat-containing protein [Planctomycetota bacterium]|nr:VCBS repeat-containing protein [Planctomycetota bacterium]
MRPQVVLRVVLLLASPVCGQSLLQEQPVEGPVLPIVGRPTAAVGHDLDNDGDDDLVVMEDTGPVILRRQPTGFVRETFSSGITSGANPVLVAGDFDADGHADLLLGWYTGFNPALRVWWGDGSGTFPTANFTSITFGFNVGVMPIAAADVDNDGDTDFVLTSQPGALTPGSLLVRNMGNRAFATAPTAQFPAAPLSISAPFCVDVDGDGWCDVVLVSEDARTRLYWNNAGNFAEATTAQFPVLQASLRGLAVADFDGDGDRDLVFGGYGEPGRLMRTTALRQLALAPGAATDLRTLELQPVDLDGDGDLDLMVFTRDQVHQRINDGAGSFAATAWLGGCEDVRHQVRVDVDGDGDRDVLRFGLGIQVSSSIISTTAVYTVTPTRFEMVGASRLPVSAGITGFATGDIDGDNLADFVVSHNEPSGSTIQFVTNDGSGVFSFRWANRTAGYENGFFTDLDSDGLDEYVFTGFDTVNGYLPNVAGTMATTKVPLPIGTATQQTTSGAGVDLDGDGDRDLIFVLAIGNNYVLRVLMNHPGGFVDESATRVFGPFGTGAYPRLYHADFDGDGDQDIWVHSWADDQLWLQQAGVLTFAAGAIPVNGYGGSESAMGDFDGDGDIDLKSGTQILRNQGGHFSVVPNALPNISGMDLLRVAVDVDDDGDIDLVGSGRVAWNTGNAIFVNATNVLPFAWGTGIGVRVVEDFDRDGDPDMVSWNGNTHRSSVLINQLRQLRLEGDADLGGAITFRHTVKPGQSAIATLTVLACSFAEIAPTEVPGFGWLRIDPTQAIPLGPFLLPAAGGEIVHQEPVPGDPALLGMFFCAQPLELRGSRLRLGNFVSTWIGR